MWTTLEKSFHKSIKAGAPMQVMNHLHSWRFLGLKAELVSRASSTMVCSTRERVQQNAVTEKEMMSKFAMSPPEQQQLMQSWTQRKNPGELETHSIYKAFSPALGWPVPTTQHSFSQELHSPPGRAPHLGRHSRNKEHTIRKEQHREKWNQCFCLSNLSH